MQNLAQEPAVSNFQNTRFELAEMDTEVTIAKTFVDSRVQAIYGGTNEIMKEIIGRSLIG